MIIIFTTIITLRITIIVVTITLNVTLTFNIWLIFTHTIAVVGANIAIATEGKYSVELFLNRAIYTYKLTKI